MALDFEGVADFRQDRRLVKAMRAFLSEALAACKAEGWDECLEDVFQDGQSVLIFDGLNESRRPDARGCGKRC